VPPPAFNALNTNTTTNSNSSISINSSTSSTVDCWGTEAWSDIPL